MVHYNFPQGPKNETDAQILTDIMDINGAGLAFVAYGVHATLFFLCFALLWEERRKKPKVTWGWIIYSTVLFILGTIGNGVNMFLKQDAIVNHRSYPGGPGQFEIEQYALPYNAAGTVIFIFGAWLIDGLMIFRFYIILSPRWWVMSIPVTVYAVSIVMSILLLHQIASWGGCNGTASASRGNTTQSNGDSPPEGAVTTLTAINNNPKRIMFREYIVEG